MNEVPEQNLFVSQGLAAFDDGTPGQEEILGIALVLELKKTKRGGQ